MKYTLNTNLIPLFNGTYNTQWEINETNDEGDELEIEYDQKELMASIARVYQKNEAYILSELNCPFIRSIHFTGGTYSPREYNFKTDELDFTVDIDETKLREALEALRGDAEFAVYLREHFTSYDGFMSFTPNNYAELYEAITKHGDEHDQALGAVITYCAKENLYDGDIQPYDGGCSIEEMVHENWQGNGYGGLVYTTV